MSTRVDALSRSQVERRISTATNKERIGSIGSQPVTVRTIPAVSAANDAARSESTCSSAARLLRVLPCESSHAQSRLTVRPAAATRITTPPATGAGARSLRPASTAIQTTTPSMINALMNAASTSARA